MIWRAVRNIFAAEILAWAAFLLVGLLLGVLGAQSGSRRVSDILVLLWVALFLGSYRFLYKRL